MAKIISQETFNDVVKENIVEFSMTSSDAKEETIKQFEAQGINLANIIKDLSLNEETGKPCLNEAVDQLKDHISGTSVLDTEQLLNCLSLLETECTKSIPHRVLAGSIGTLEVLLLIVEKALSMPGDCQLPVSIGIFCENTTARLCNVSDSEKIAGRRQCHAKPTTRHIRCRNVDGFDKNSQHPDRRAIDLRRFAADHQGLCVARDKSAKHYER